MQELAKHCVAARLRTDLGTATQTLGALEQTVRQLSKALLPGAEGSASGPLPVEQLQPAHVLLQFLFALEQSVSNGVHGSSLRPPPPQSAALFFAANDKASLSGQPRCG